MFNLNSAWSAYDFEIEIQFLNQIATYRQVLDGTAVVQ